LEGRIAAHPATRHPEISRQHSRQGPGKEAQLQSGSRPATLPGWILGQGLASRQWKSKALKHMSVPRGGRKQHRSHHRKQSQTCSSALPSPQSPQSPSLRLRFPPDLHNRPPRRDPRPGHRRHLAQHQLPGRNVQSLASQQLPYKALPNIASMALRTLSVVITLRLTPATPPHSHPSHQPTLSPSYCFATAL
jgi:hypothetical protein